MSNIWQSIYNLWSWITWERTQIAGLAVRVSELEERVKKMADVLDTVKADFEDYKAAVDQRLTDLAATIAGLLAGQLDPAKAQAIDDEIKAAKAALNPPTP